MQRLFACFCTLFLLSACAGGGAKLQAVRPSDKYLTCTDIKTEMHEAEVHRDKARRKTGPSLDNLLDGMGYVGTFLQSETTISRAEERLEHLGDLYTIKGCSYQTSPMQAQLMPPMPVDPNARRVPAGQVQQWMNGGVAPYPAAAAGMAPMMQGVLAMQQTAPAAGGIGSFEQPAAAPPPVGRIHP